MIIQTINLYQVLADKLHIRYMLMKVLRAGTKGTNGTCILKEKNFSSEF